MEDIEIKELTKKVEGADTSTEEGRQVVADSCRQLYNLFEVRVYQSDRAWLLTGIYSQLFSGCFAEPFMCEQKKQAFKTVVTVFNLVPKLK